MLGIVAIIALTTVFVGCNKTTVVQNPQEALSQTFFLEAKDWAHVKTNYLRASLEFNEIDQQIVDQGAVWAYLSFDGGKSFEFLPTIIDDVSYAFTHANKDITIHALRPDGNAIANPGRLVLKVVSIPARSLTITSNVVDKSNYNAVKAAFNLVD